MRLQGTLQLQRTRPPYPLLKLMVMAVVLFVTGALAGMFALQSRQEATATNRLAAGPEGAGYQDLRVVSALIERLLGQVPTLFGPTQEAAERERLQQAFAAAKAQFQRLEQALGQGSGHVG